MGGGSWSAQTYNRTTQAKINSGTTFGYATYARQTGQMKPHELLDPKRLNAAGLNIRESRDNGDVESLPLIIGLDGTGSMGRIPGEVQKKLAGLFGLLVRKGYCGDAIPQLAITMYGDAKTDQIPLQFSQFEADNRFEEQGLDNLVHEGNGGGNFGESQSLAWYYMVHHVVTDAWEKRGKKGYYFVIADEISHELTAQQVKDNVGDGEPLGSLRTADLAKALQEKWEVVVLLIDNMSARSQGSQKFYSDLFGAQNVLVVENPDTIAETIGAAIGMMENSDLDVDELEDDLVDVGYDRQIAGATVKTVARLGGRSNGTVARGMVDLDLS